jgi:hypothetical protein
VQNKYTTPEQPFFADAPGSGPSLVPQDYLDKYAAGETAVHYGDQIYDNQPYDGVSQTFQVRRDPAIKAYVNEAIRSPIDQFINSPGAVEALAAGNPIPGIPANISAAYQNNPTAMQSLQSYADAAAAYNALPRNPYSPNQNADQSFQGYMSPKMIENRQTYNKQIANAFTGLAQQGSADLANSYNSYVTDYYNNQAAENQAYQEQIGENYAGGIIPWANNPQWSDTTPAWNPGYFNNSEPQQMQNAAAQSPWGQPGAPWASQAWASGSLEGGPEYAKSPFGGIEGQRQSQPQPLQWSTNTFNPQSGFNPQLFTNAPWGPPQNPGTFRPPSGFGQQQGQTTSPMTFGSNPWGSFW